MNRGQLAQQIVAEERGRTREEIFSPQAMSDLHEIWMRVQGAANSYAIEQDRPFDYRGLPTPMNLMGNEIGRVSVRHAALNPEFS